MPHQHVPARRQLREVRHRPRRHADRPAHWDDEPFEAIVSNPPYSIKWDGDANPLLINDPRFAPAGVLAPKSKADLAFTMHMLSWLAVNGTAAIVEFPGVLYRGGAEQKIRKYLVDNNYVDTVIQLPPDLFFGTTIATCIIVLKKSKTDNKILFIDASAEFVRQGNKNKLTEREPAEDPRRLHAREDVDHFATLVENADDRRERLQHRGLLLRRGRGHPRGRRHQGAQRRDRPDRRAAGRAARRDRRDRRRPRGRRGVSRIDELIAELCPDGVEFKALGEVGEFVRGNGLQKKDFTDAGSPCIHYGQIYTVLRH